MLSLLSVTGTTTLTEEQYAAFRSAALPMFGIVMIAIGISLAEVCQMLSS